jgi:NAD(P)H-dependent FMN reductase
MKLVGIVGSNAEKSYNRMLLKAIQTQFSHLFELELLEIDQVPLFNRSNDQTNSPSIQFLNKKIQAADGVIISTPEHNRTVPPALKSVIEWLSYQIHPFVDKPVLVIGASYFDQGTSRAQLHLKQILEAPGVGAYVFPGNEFLLGNAKKAFDENGQLARSDTQVFLGSVLEKFTKYVNILNQVADAEVTPLERVPTQEKNIQKEAAKTTNKQLSEDLFSNRPIKTTIKKINMEATNWVEHAAKRTNAATGDTYLELNRGILTVNQLNHFLNSMPMELNLFDSNNQFLYYNKQKDEKFLARKHSDVGKSVGTLYSETDQQELSWIISKLRSGEMEVHRKHVPSDNPKEFIVHTYRALRDDRGKYLGINKYVQNIQPIVDWYLEETGQALVDKKVEATDTVDAVSGASENS